MRGAEQEPFLRALLRLITTLATPLQAAAAQQAYFFRKWARRELRRRAPGLWRRRRRLTAILVLLSTLLLLFLAFSAVYRIMSAAAVKEGPITAAKRFRLVQEASRREIGGRNSPEVFAGDGEEDEISRAQAEALQRKIDEELAKKFDIVKDERVFGKEEAVNDGRENEEQHFVALKAKRERKKERMMRDVSQLRDSRRFLLLRVEKEMDESKSKISKKKRSGEFVDESAGVGALLGAAMNQMGYRPLSIESVPSKDLLWIGSPEVECTSSQLSKLLNRIPETKDLIIFCFGDVQWVSHMNRKDVLDQRLQWYDLKLHRHSECILYSDFIPKTFTVNPFGDLGSLAEELQGTDDKLFILKHQRETFGSKSLPMVTDDPVKAIKSLRKHSHDSEGLMVQAYKANALLWDGKRFVLRTWAFLASSNPFVALFHDGVVLKAIDSLVSVRNSKAKRKTRSFLERLANVTTRQNEHPEYERRKAEAYACFEDLQEYLSGKYRNNEMLHYVELILKPYLKKLMLFALQSLRREHLHDSPNIWALQYLCFDFMIDVNWNVWLLDVNPQCDPQTGGRDFASACKRRARHGLGPGSIQIAEQLYYFRKTAKKTSWLDGLDIGSLEVLFDETSSILPHNPEEEICKRSLYQDFRNRQTFGKRVIQELLPLDGRPPFEFEDSVGHQGLDKWECNTCGFLNDDMASHHCEYCGDLQDSRVANAVRGSMKEELDNFFSDTERKVGRPSRDHLKQEDSFHKVIPRSEIAVKISSCGGKAFELREGIEIVGFDIEPLRSTSHGACCFSCSMHPRCVGFTFVEDSLQCWLKSRVEVEGHRKGRISGVLQASSLEIRGQVLNTGVHHSSEKAKRDFFKQQLTDIFLKHDPNKVSKVDILLDRYRGNEERFIARTIRQYEEIELLVQERQQNRFSHHSLVAKPRDVHGLTVEDYRDRIRGILQKNDPTKLSDVDSMLVHFQGREMDLLQNLIKKYND